MHLKNYLPFQRFRKSYQSLLRNDTSFPPLPRVCGNEIGHNSCDRRPITNIWSIKRNKNSITSIKLSSRCMCVKKWLSKSDCGATWNNLSIVHLWKWRILCASAVLSAKGTFFLEIFENFVVCLFILCKSARMFSCGLSNFRRVEFPTITHLKIVRKSHLHPKCGLTFEVPFSWPESNENRVRREFFNETGPLPGASDQCHCCNYSNACTFE